MYYQLQQQQAKNMHALRMQMQGGGNDSGGLVLSTDAKPRLKWTPDLHERFIEAVNQLGGADSESIYEAPAQTQTPNTTQTQT